MPRKWWVLTTVACGTFMATLDSSIVNIALPSLTKSLGTDLSQIKWVVIIYLLVITILLLPFGRLSDLAGRKKIFQWGFAIFTFGSLLCGLSDHLSLLLFSRVIQGAGAAMLMANGPAIITAAFTDDDRGQALGTLAMVVSAGLVTGPSVGGYLIAHFGWTSIFLVNLPVGLAGIALAQHFVERDRERKVHAPFDWAGAILQMILLLLFIVLVDPPWIAISGGTAVPLSRWFLTMLLAGFGFVFYKVESDAQAPLFDLSLMKIQTFWTANLASFLCFVAYSAVNVLMPFYFEEALRLEPDRAGLFMTWIPITIFVIAPISGRISDRVGSREISILGAFVGAMGLLVMSGVFGGGLTLRTSREALALYLCSIGMAIGLFQSPNNNAIMGAVPMSKLGVASALLATVRNLGLVTGTGLATGLFYWRQRVGGGNFMGALHFTFAVAACIAAGATLVSFGKKIDG